MQDIDLKDITSELDSKIVRKLREVTRNAPKHKITIEIDDFQMKALSYYAEMTGSAPTKQVENLVQTSIDEWYGWELEDGEVKTIIY